MPAIAPTWTSLPAEMKLAVVDALNDADILALAKVDTASYRACVPSLFRKVKLDTFEALEQFLDAVPRPYLTHIEELYICTANRDIHSTPVLPRIRADAVIALLSATPRLAKLALITHGSLDKSVLAPFPYLQSLRELSIANCGDEKMNPLSERLVVSIALSIQHLEVLSLDRITRSKLHAPDLIGKFTPVPLCLSDHDIPAHPILGTDLSLPSLLRIPTLRRLTIRDTHLGDPRWATVPVSCKLGVLDLGSCYHEDDGFNTRCTERIMAAVGETVDEFSLTAAVSDAVFAKPHATPLARLRRLHISPYFPIESVVDTVANLAGSPVERISVQCFEEDMVDVCGALEEFLSLRLEKGEGFYQNLQRIDVSVTTDAASDDGSDDDDDSDADVNMHRGSSSSSSSGATEEEIEERNRAARHLLEFCKDLQLASMVGKVSNSAKLGKVGTSFEAEAFNQKMDIFSRPVVKSMDSFTSFTDVKRFHTKGRSMSL